MVDENTNGSRLADIGRQFTQSLRHQSRLQPHFRFAHLAFDFGLRRQRGDRVDHHDIDGARTDQVVGDLQRLLPVVGLRNQQVVDIHAELLRIRAVESMFRVDKCGDSARFLGLGDRVDSQRGFTRRFGAENLDNTSFRIPADPERMVDRYRPGRDDRDFVDRPVAHFHDGAFPEILLDLIHHGAQYLELLRIHLRLLLFCHIFSFSSLVSNFSGFTGKLRRSVRSDPSSALYRKSSRSRPVRRSRTSSAEAP